MNLQELIDHLDRLGVVMVAEEGRLRVNAARGQLTDELKATIADHKSELLSMLADRQARRQQGATADPLLVAGAAPRLSLFQERLWVLNRLEPESSAYHVAALLPGFEAASVDAIAAAIRLVLRNHEILRSCVDDGDVPMPKLLPVEAVPIEVVDLTGHPEHRHQTELQAMAETAVHRPFDLAVQPPVRFIIVRLRDERTATLVVAHHIALDAWSTSMLGQAIRVALSTGRCDSPPLQYSAYAAWQHQTQDSARVDAELGWWKERLKGIPQTSAFPPDFTAPALPAGATWSFHWSQELGQALGALARENGATTYMVLMAAIAIVLQRHTGQSDIVLGSPMGLRERPEFEAIIGPFVNLLVVRLDLGDDPTFSELLKRVRNALLDAHEHRSVSFERLIEQLKPERSFGHGPIFQVALVQHNAPVDGAVPVAGGGAMHELTVFVRESNDGLVGAFEYRSDLYAQASIERIADQVQVLLAHAVANSQCPISNLSVLSPSVRSLLIAGFNDTRIDLDDRIFVRQFEDRVKAAPQAIALGCHGEAVSYAELNARSNRLARHLSAHGAGSGCLIAVCMGRSVELLVALLAVQKAGAAYVPLDPGFPADRIAYMIEDSTASILLADADSLASLDVPPTLQVVDLARDATSWAGLDSSDLASAAAASDVAYVIYTSGSTGRPKGVAVSHGALSNFLGSMKREPGLAPTDILAAVTTISFDIAGLELFLPLLVGARIELVARETATDGHALAQLLASCAATVLQATPATWRLLIEAEWRPSVSGFRALCGGEALPRDLANALLERVETLWNLYGPTETTIWSAVQQIAAGDGDILIGRPIANTEIYVLDRSGQPTPIGVAGEIWIAGAGVALGYHRRPELTAERFVADGFSDRPNARMYRTGDLGRWMLDGRLQHLGRIDHQVKIRGFRIELGEIEAALAAHEAVRQAVVVAREAAPGDLRLVAYVTYAPGEDLTVSDVRRHLRRELPDYMLPSIVVALDTIPLTANGKVDRAALPDPFRAVQGADRQYTPPAPGLEQIMAQVWADLLKVERVGADDNFFELGGHSLLSLRVVAAIEKQTGWRMDPRVLFFQNLRQIAAGASANIARTEFMQNEGSLRG